MRQARAALAWLALVAASASSWSVRVFDIRVPLAQDPGKDHAAIPVCPNLSDLVAKKLHVRPEELKDMRLVRKSFDARKRQRGGQGVSFVYTVDVDLSPSVRQALKFKPGQVERAPPPESESVPPLPAVPASCKGARVVVVGSGPAGLFAALTLADAGLKPIIIERGQPVQRRGRDLGALFARGILNEDSNLCRGEGGAGTWSDGKLTTRIGRNSGQVRHVLRTFVKYGAPERILVDSKPHLGTERLVRILMNMRAALLALGAVYMWGTRVDDLVLDGSGERVTGVVLSDGSTLPADMVVLAIGHSARELVRKLALRGVALSPKQFAAGYRIEHPQALIDSIQYGPKVAELVLKGKGKVPVADYKLVAQGGARQAYSFCQCPGGQIVPTSLTLDELCINGMSFSRRGSIWANSGIVVQIGVSDMAEGGGDPDDPFVGMEWQRSIEKRAAEAGGGNLVVPVQRATDFLMGKVSTGQLPSSSYRLGVGSAPCHDLYPAFVVEAVASALEEFEKRMPGYISPEALIHGVETRTSSPVQITRDPTTLESISRANLYPAGEGCGYAGGIVSAAVDGVNVGRSIIARLAGVTQAPPTAAVESY